MPVQTDKSALDVIRRFDSAQTERRMYWDSLFQQCKDVVWPNTLDFTSTRQQGAPLIEFCYDSTAPWANGQFANGMHSALANPFERWFNFAPDDYRLAEDGDTLAWLEIVSDIIYQMYSHPRANLKQALHETFLSLGCFGTAVLFQDWDDELLIPVFRSIPLSDCFLKENEKGFIDTVFRIVKLSLIQAKERFGEDNLPAKMLETKQEENRTFEFIHLVEPRKNRDISSSTYVNMAYASDWVAKEFSQTVWSGGYDTFPYHCPRWEKLPGQVYGRSPAMTCLADIRVLNQMKKVTMEAAQKVVNPPMLAPHDAFISQLDFTPGAINEYDSSSGMPPDAFRPLNSGADVKIGNDLLQDLRASVIQCFYADQMNIPFKKERQTAVEINARRDDMLRNIAPLIGRQESELLGDMLKRTYQMGSKWNRIPPHPVKIQSMKMKIIFISRAAFAQKGGKLNSIKGFITETFVPLMQIAPEVKDKVDMDELLEQSAELSDVTRKIFRTPEQIAAIRQDRAKQQAAQQQLQAAESASTSLKNVGQAAQASPALVGQ